MQVGDDASYDYDDNASNVDNENDDADDGKDADGDVDDGHAEYDYDDFLLMTTMMRTAITMLTTMLMLDMRWTCDGNDIVIATTLPSHAQVIAM